MPQKGHRYMKRSRAAYILLATSTTFVACKPRPVPDDTSKGSVLADTGFRPTQNGFKFQNEGGQYPKTPPVLTSAGVAKMFGKEACLGGNEKSCKLTPAATEWMGVVNRAMNIGQCEGMAVGSLAFFKKINDPTQFAAGAASAHDLTHANVGPLIGYYWAFQMVNPVRFQTIKSLFTQTPNGAEDTLVDMMKRGELATLAIRSTHGGHAVTPYAVEDRGNGIHWIRIYDNNWPDKERYVIIDRNANTWKYELASLNPDVPREPWAGDAESRSIAVTPLSYRLGKAECPFCIGSKKMVFPHGTNSITLTNQDGKRVGRDGDKIVNEIPDAEVIHLASYLEGAPEGEPIYAVPHDGDYDIHLHGNDRKTTDAHPDGDHGVAIIGNGSAVAVETQKLKPGEKDTLSVHHEGGVKYSSGNGGTIPPIRLAHDGDGTHGMSARITNMKAGAHEPVELKVDHKAGEVHVAGGGKSSESFDLKVKHAHAGADDHEVEQKGIKFKAGETHTIHTDPKPGAKAGPLKITHAPTPVQKSEPAKGHQAPPHTPATPPGKPKHR
jgi:hypothetical protein